MVEIDEAGYIKNPYQNFIAISRYARWNDELGRRETWVETVDRYMNFMRDHLSTNNGYAMTDAEYDEMHNAITTMQVLPSMRALMTAGPALKKNNIAGYNPVAGNTKVLTREFGMIEISKLAGTEATVLNVEGRWAQANFNSYGIQDTFTVRLRKNTNTFMQVDATENHRWILSDGTVLDTRNLVKGDKIPFSTAPKPDDNNLDYKLGIIHGLIYGDGTATYSQKRLNGYHIRLCSDANDLLPYFEGHGKVTYPASANGDPVVMLYGSFAKTHELKELPVDETEEYILGFMRGWMAADGSVGANSQVSLAVTQEGLEWFRSEAVKVGFIEQNLDEYPSKTNFGDRKRSLYRITIDRSSCVKEDFIIIRKRNNFRELKSEFTVESVMKTGLSEEVFCAEVPDTNTFVLSKGLVTGNCSYIPVDSPRAFDEVLYVLMHGTGVGFSVESKYTEKLPTVADEFEETSTVIVVDDSKEGWQKAFKELIAMLYAGNIATWDVSKVRPKGARLKTFGGRASGPEPLVELFEFTTKLFQKASGRKLTTMECHDLVCKIAEIVVVGGVRRSALISLSDLRDDEIACSKVGAWWESNSQRALANNSAVYETKPGLGTFLREWTNLYDSKSGERGIFNREAAAIAAGRSGRRQIDGIEFGTNPCSEINLRPYQFCNLSTVPVAGEDKIEDLHNKVRLAATLGTWQSTLTNFKGLRAIWKKNTEEERLLGVSMTGIFGNELLNGKKKNLPERLEELKATAVYTNAEWAEKLGIQQSTAVTCVKPEGNASQLTGTSSGIHPWHSPHYIRTVRSDKKDPLGQFLRDSGVPCEDDVMNPETGDVFSFPIKAPENAIVRNDLTAIEHLDLWLTYQRHWCEHKPSVTINVKEDEWLEVAAWVYKNFDEVTGVSFLPHSDHTYKQAPYQEIDAKQFAEAVKNMPETLHWELLAHYEENDENVIGGRELACSASTGCEVIDLTSK
jgi:ribonucleoside-triphosphate reductase